MLTGLANTPELMKAGLIVLDRAHRIRFLQLKHMEEK